MNKTSDERKKFYMSFFENKEGYDEKKVNNHWLIKQYDGNTKSWTVHLYSEQSYRNYKRANALFKERGEQMDFLKSI